MIPHSKGGYEYISRNFDRIMEMVKKENGNE